MKKSFVPASLLVCLSLALQGCGSSSSGGGGDQPNNNVAGDTTPLGCPTNYVLVPASTDFNVSEFCVAKYEAKQVNGGPESVATGTPWVSVTRDQAKAACASKGSRYALMDNAHWMTIARNIEATTWNFGGDPAQQEYGPSRGITNNNGTSTFPASTDDNNSCYLATQQSGGPAASCSLTTYDVARRVHKLSNDSLIWDFAGNASEWISDDITTVYNIKDWVLNITDTSFKSVYGPAGSYPTGPSNPTGNIYMYNFGYINTQLASPRAVFRGGGYSYGRYAGIYTMYFVTTTTTNTDIGFRCYYQPRVN